MAQELKDQTPASQHELDILTFKSIWDERLPAGIKAMLINELRVIDVDRARHITQYERKHFPRTTHEAASLTLDSIMSLDSADFQQLLDLGVYVNEAGDGQDPQRALKHDLDSFFTVAEVIAAAQFPMNDQDTLHADLKNLNTLRYMCAYSMLWNLPGLQDVLPNSRDEHGRAISEALNIQQKKIRLLKYIYLLFRAIRTDDVELFISILGKAHLNIAMHADKAELMQAYLGQAVIHNATHIVRACLALGAKVDTRDWVYTGERQNHDGQDATLLERCEYVKDAIDQCLKSDYPDAQTLHMACILLSAHNDPSGLLKKRFMHFSHRDPVKACRLFERFAKMSLGSLKQFYDREWEEAFEYASAVFLEGTYMDEYPPKVRLEICDYLLAEVKDREKVLLKVFKNLLDKGETEKAKHHFKRFNICPNGYYRYDADDHPMVAAIEAADPDILEMLVDAGGDLRSVILSTDIIENLIQSFEVIVRTKEQLNINRRVVQCFKLLAERGIDYKNALYSAAYRDLEGCLFLMRYREIPGVAIDGERVTADEVVAAKQKFEAVLDALGRRKHPGSFEQLTMTIIGAITGLIYGCLLMPLFVGRALTAWHRYWRRDIFKSILDLNESSFIKVIRLCVHVILLITYPVIIILTYLSFPIFSAISGMKDGECNGLSALNFKRQILRSESLLSDAMNFILGDFTASTRYVSRLNILMLDHRLSTYIWSIGLGLSIAFLFVIPSMSITILPSSLLHLLPGFFQILEKGFTLGGTLFVKIDAGLSLFLSASFLVVGRLLSWLVKGIEYIVKTPVGETSATEQANEEGARPTYEMLSSKLGIDSPNKSGTNVVPIVTEPPVSQPADASGGPHPTSLGTLPEGGYTHTEQPQHAS